MWRHNEKLYALYTKIKHYCYQDGSYWTHNSMHIMTKCNHATKQVCTLKVCKSDNNVYMRVIGWWISSWCVICLLKKKMIKNKMAALSSNQKGWVWCKCLHLYPGPERKLGEGPLSPTFFFYPFPEIISRDAISETAWVEALTIRIPLILAKKKLTVMSGRRAQEQVEIKIIMFQIIIFYIQPYRWHSPGWPALLSHDWNELYIS